MAVLSADLGLDGAVVVVSGGSSGIGLATVERLVAVRCRVAACARDLARLCRATSHLDPALVEVVRADWLQQQAVTRRIPMGRPGRAEEVADAVVLLLSPILAYTTGATLAVTGGLPG